jgi:PEP-CTERM motif
MRSHRDAKRLVSIVTGLLAAAHAFALPVLESSDPGAANATTHVIHHNDLGLPGGTDQTVLVGAELLATGPGSLLWTYLGKEARYTNAVSFSLFAGGCSFSTASSFTGSTCSDSTAGGALEFRFTSSGALGAVSNGDDFSFSAPIVFGLQRFGDFRWRVLLDDSGGHPNDKDFDDLGLLVEFSPESLPEPGSTTLLLAGLAALAVMRRHTAKAASIRI